MEFCICTANQSQGKSGLTDVYNQDPGKFIMEYAKYI